MIYSVEQIPAAKRPAIIKDYAAGSSLKNVGAKHGVDPKTIRSFLARNKVQIRKPGQIVKNGKAVYALEDPEVIAKSVAVRAANTVTEEKRKRKNANQQAWRAKRRAATQATAAAAPTAPVIKKLLVAKTSPTKTIASNGSSAGQALLRTLYDGGQITKSDIVAFAAIVLAA